MTPIIPKLSNSKNMNGQIVSWNKMLDKTALDDKDVANKPQLYAKASTETEDDLYIHVCTSNIISIAMFSCLSFLHSYHYPWIYIK